MLMMVCVDGVCCRELMVVCVDGGCIPDFMVSVGSHMVVAGILVVGLSL